MRLAQRQSYLGIFKKYKKIGKGKVRLTQSTLLLAQAISANRTSYTFPILESDNATTPLTEEIRLNINDEFVSYDVGYYLFGDQEIQGAGNTPAGTRWITYAPAELDSAFAGLTDAWMGTLQIEVNKINYLDRWDLKKHHYIPRTQFDDSVLTALRATQPSIDFSVHGTIPMQPMITLSGAKKNTISISLVRAISSASGVWITPDTDNIGFNISNLALIFRGLLAQNAAKFQT